MVYHTLFIYLVTPTLMMPSAISLQSMIFNGSCLVWSSSRLLCTTWTYIQLSSKRDSCISREILDPTHLSTNRLPIRLAKDLQLSCLRRVTSANITEVTDQSIISLRIVSHSLFPSQFHSSSILSQPLSYSAFSALDLFSTKLRLLTTASYTISPGSWLGWSQLIWSPVSWSLLIPKWFSEIWFIDSTKK